MSVLFGAIGRNFWPTTAAAGILALIAAATGYYEAMAILACIFGGLLMWEAERHPEQPAVSEGIAEPVAAPVP